MSVIEQDKQIVDFANTQWKIFWSPDEVKVEKDLQDLLVNLTPSEKHGVITTLKLFTLYELAAGEDYWLGRFFNTFPEVEYRRMASVFGAFELAVHKPFYQKINELLHLHTDSFYDSYTQDPILKERMGFINKYINSKNTPLSLAVFSLIEGAILYSSFAFLKHFQSKGKNKMLNITRGINFSVRDENLHSLAGAYVYNKFVEGRDTESLEELHTDIYQAAKELLEHEYRIVDMIFEQGEIEGITPTQMKNFVLSRVNQCLHELKLKNLEKVSYNPIAEWFYDGITGFQYNDFFSGMGASYHRSWDEDSFTWKVDNAASV